MIYYSEIQDRKKVLNQLERAYDEGFRYVVRGEESMFLCLFNHKPKRYTEYKDWGYTQKDIDNEKSMPAHPIKNTDMIEINYSNKSATTIASLIGIKE